MIRSRLAVVFACLVLAACSGTEGSEVALNDGDLGDEKIDVCALLPPADLVKITGKDISDAKGHFSEHKYMKPVNFTSGCIYSGGGAAFIISVNYPRQASKESSQQLAQRLGDFIRSQYQDDPDLAEVYANIEMRPVEGMVGPAAEYRILDQSHLELHAPGRLVKVVAGSIDEARTLADTLVARLD